jgi:hypothetical protein
MLMTNQHSIQDVLFFPQMRPEKIQLELTDEEKQILAVFTFLLFGFKALLFFEAFGFSTSDSYCP